MNSPASDPLAVLWRPSTLIGVVLIGEALAAILTLAPAQNADLLVHFGLMSLGIQWVTLGTLCAMFLLRRPLGRLPPLSLAWACLTLFLLMSLLVTEAAWGVLLLTGNDAGSRAAFVARMMGIATVVGLLGLLAYQNYWQSRQLAIRTQQLKLEALQARIQPHFLFNTLNTVVAFLHTRPDTAEQVLLDLADLFRSALRGPQAIPLAEELALTRRYLDIEALRLGPRLQLVWDVPETLPDISVPSLSIQPLAENAIRHGIERRPSGGCLDVTVQVEQQGVVITLRNDMASTDDGPKGHAIGLASARERVQAMTNGRGRIDAAVQDGRFVVRMQLPA